MAGLGSGLASHTRLHDEECAMRLRDMFKLLPKAQVETEAGGTAEALVGSGWGGAGTAGAFGNETVEQEQELDERVEELPQQQQQPDAMQHEHREQPKRQEQGQDTQETQELQPKWRSQSLYWSWNENGAYT
jgi:hypothetical protein